MRKAAAMVIGMEIFRKAADIPARRLSMDMAREKNKISFQDRS